MSHNFCGAHHMLMVTEFVTTRKHIVQPRTGPLFFTLNFPLCPDFSLSLQISQCANKPPRSVSEQTELRGEKRIRETWSSWVGVCSEIHIFFSPYIQLGLNQCPFLLIKYTLPESVVQKLTLFVKSYAVSGLLPLRQAGGPSTVHCSPSSSFSLSSCVQRQREQIKHSQWLSVAISVFFNYSCLHKIRLARGAVFDKLGKAVDI